ncbi:MAG: hypothetical protein ABI775_07745 [Pseudonocardiales bacterium]
MFETILVAGAGTAEARAGRLLVDELHPRFAQSLGHDVVVAFANAAVRDLRGSVKLEALPEMAARLAHHRLTVIAQRRWAEVATNVGRSQRRPDVTAYQVG